MVKKKNIQNQEQENNPTGNLNDSFNQTQSGMPNTSGMSLKEIGLLLLLAVIGFAGYAVYKLLT